MSLPLQRVDRVSEHGGAHNMMTLPYRTKAKRILLIWLGPQIKYVCLASQIGLLEASRGLLALGCWSGSTWSSTEARVGMAPAEPRA